MNELIPLFDNIIIEPIEDTSTTSGIYIPDTIKEKPMKGKIVNVGDGYNITTGLVIPVTLVIDDIILYNRNSGVEYKTQDGKTLVFIKYSDVFAKIK
jgi:chaperonin GroES